ncbi:hypothetical protein FHW04_003870 [Pantoea sp. AN62]
MLDGTKQADVQGGGGMSQGDYSTELKTARSHGPLRLPGVAGSSVLLR